MIVKLFKFFTSPYNNLDFVYNKYNLTITQCLTHRYTKGTSLGHQAYLPSCTNNK